MPKKLKPIPTFATEAEEREFWQRTDSSDYIYWRKAKRARFPNLKRSTESGAASLPKKGG